MTEPPIESSFASSAASPAASSAVSAVDSSGETVARHAAIAALLNLTGLGLGYLYLRAYRALLVAWVAIPVLFCCAGVASPKIWLVIAAVWALGTAVHALAVPDANPRQPLVSLPVWLAAILSAAILATIIGGGVMLINQGRGHVAEATAAQEAGDCGRMEAELARLHPWHLFSFGRGATRNQQELCEHLLAGRSAAVSGEYLAAFIHYAAYSDGGGGFDTGPEVAQMYVPAAEMVEEGAACEALDWVDYFLLIGSSSPDYRAVDRAEPRFARFEEYRYNEAARVAAEPVVAAAEADRPGALLGCGRERLAAGDTEAAEELLETLLGSYPGDDLAGEAEETLAEIADERRRQEEEQAQRDIERAIDDIAGGRHGEIDAPPASGGAPAGEVVLNIGNDSNRRLELLYSGPETGRLTIESGSRCGGSEVSISLPPGTYQVVVRATGGGVVPYYGAWSLSSGTAYTDCYYIEFG